MSDCDIFIQSMQQNLSKVKGDIYRFAFFSPSKTFKPSSCSEELEKYLDNFEFHTIAIEKMRVSNSVPYSVNFGILNRFKMFINGDAEIIYCSIIKKAKERKIFYFGKE